MKKKVAKLSKRARERVESEYHRMKPEDLDEVMSVASQHTPNAVRLPSHLVRKLKSVAERQGKTEYQTIVTAWIEERLQQEAKVAR